MIDTKMHASKSSSPTPGILMDVNADLTRRVVVDTAQIPWVPSSSGTVWRKPLFRQGGEFRPVTSLVRCALGGVFPDHAHSEDKEILVLDGVFPTSMEITRPEPS